MSLETPTADNGRPFSRFFSGGPLNILAGIVAIGFVAYSAFTSFSREHKNDQVDTWNGVIYCHNTTDKHIINEIYLYQNKINLEQPAQTTYQGLSGANRTDWEICKNYLTAAMNKKNQAAEITAAVQDFQRAGNALIEALAEVAPYYQAKTYLTDQFANGKAKDASLQDLIKKYNVAGDKLSDEVDRVADIQRQADIAEALRDPKRKNEAAVMTMIATAKKTEKAIAAEPVDQNTLQANITLLEKQINDFRNNVLSDVKRGPNQNKYTGWKTFTENMSKYFNEAKGVIGTTANEDQYAAIDQALDDYDRMINHYNQIIHDPKNYPISAATE